MTQRLLGLVGLAAILIACSAGSSGGPSPSIPSASVSAPSTSVSATPASPNVSGSPEAFVAKGHVTDSAGHPLSGVVVTADFQLQEDYGLDGTTDANGDYRIVLDQPISSWHMSALYRTNWNGVDYGFDLDPVDDSPFTGADGGTRDFVWRLTGPTPDPDQSYGATVLAYVDFSGSVAIDPQYVVLTLVPDGPLVDGSTGNTVTGTGDRLDGVAVGRYLVTATYHEPGNAARELFVRVRNEGDFAAEVSAQFEQVSVTGQHLELEVRS